MFPLLQNAFLRFRSPRSLKKVAPKRRQPQRRFEALETRNLLAANIVLSPVTMDLSYADVGLTNNVVGEFRAVVDGQVDKSAGNYSAQIDWGDGSGYQTGKIILKGQASSSPFQIKGSHVYEEVGNYTVTVRVSGGGITVTKETGIRTVRQMPSGLPGTKPPVSESGGKQVDLLMGSISTIRSYAGVGFELNSLATLRGFLNGQINKTIGDYKAYINWGDDSLWTEASLAPKLNSSHDFLVKGSHVYRTAGNYRVVVYATGPDGTSISEDTVTIVVNNMPNGFQGTQPGMSAGYQSPSDVQLILYPENAINGYSGVPLVEYAVGEFNSYLNGKKETPAAITQYDAQINWGDSGGWTTGTIVANANGSSIQFQVLGSHRYEQSGRYNIVVYLTGPDGTSLAEQTAVAIVAKSATPVLTGSVTQTVTQGHVVSGPLASFDSDDASTPPSRLRATVDWGDGTPPQNAPIQLRGGTGTIYEIAPPPKTYGTPGTYRTTVVVDDRNGNESSWQTVYTVVSNKADLSPAISADRVVPTAAKDLNLNFLFGNEKLTVPVVVRNLGGGTAKGTARVSLYLSAARTLDGSATRLKTQDVSMNLVSGARQTVTMNITVPTGLVIGRKYFLIARVTSSIREATTANNDGRTSRAFEFVGTPKSNPTVFTNGTFFTFVRNTLKGTPDLPDTINRASDRSFIGHFEGARLYAYLDTKKIPTIGIGINLNTVSGALKANLAKAVRSYYLTTYKQRLSSDDTAVINMLKADARAKAKKIAMSRTDMYSLFDQALPKYEKIARDALGASVYGALTAHQRVAVLSMTYNLGSLSDFPSMVKGFKNNKLLQAGFNLVDAKRTTQAAGLTRRTGVEFANFFYGQEHLLGKSVAI